MNVCVSAAAQVLLKKRLEQIAQEYVDQSRADSHLPLHERPPVSVCIAARAWIPAFMQELVRQETPKGTAPPALRMPTESDNAGAKQAQKIRRKTEPRTPAKRAAKEKVSKNGVKNTRI